MDNISFTTTHVVSTRSKAPILIGYGRWITTALNGFLTTSGGEWATHAL